MSVESNPHRSVVVAIDFAEMTDFVLATAVEQARFRNPAVLHIVCAIDPSTEIIVDGQVLVDELDELERAMTARVEDRMKQAGVAYQVHGTLGRAAAMIADVAREQRAVLIVIGRHSRARKVNAGSVPAEILNLARCSVLVVQPPDYGAKPPVM
jgi:nucleotide-binding universal stress UspA family protein